jgi:N-acetylmuramoyl-L-alanine amidase
MSNPYDEARLLNADYQRAQAEAIVRGVEKFLLSVKE